MHGALDGMPSRSTGTARTDSQWGAAAGLPSADRDNRGQDHTTRECRADRDADGRADARADRDPGPNAPDRQLAAHADLD